MNTQVVYKQSPECRTVMNGDGEKKCIFHTLASLFRAQWADSSAQKKVETEGGNYASKWPKKPKQ